MLQYGRDRNNSLVNRITNLPIEREISLKEKLWEEFLDSFPTETLKPLDRTDLEVVVWKMIKQQNKDAELVSQAFICCTDNQLIRVAGHMFVALDIAPYLDKILKDENYIRLYHEKDEIAHAFDLDNPYLIRYHIFALWSRMNVCLADEKPSDKQNSELAVILEELQLIYKKIKQISEHQAFYYQLMAIITYLLAVPLLKLGHPLYDKDRGVVCLKEALIDFGISELFYETQQKDTFLTTFGAGMFADLPLKSFAEYKDFLVSRQYLDNEQLMLAITETTKRFEALFAKSKTASFK